MPEIDYNYEPAWDLISSGNTIGVFQLESSIGRHYSKLIKPRSIPELADVISLIRPACLQAHMEDGKNLTEHYAMRKHGIEPVQYLIPELEPILKDTYGILCFQEQAITIGTKLAGLSPGDADFFIRKVLGKKRTDLIDKTVELILAGLVKNGINEVKGLELVNWVRAGQRYSFNKCLAYNTIVHKATDVKNGTIYASECSLIKDIKIGDYVECPNIKECDNINYYKVLDVIYQGYQDCWFIKTQNYNITCTLEHKFMTEWGLKSVFEIIKNNLGIMVRESLDKYEPIISMVHVGPTLCYDLTIDSEEHVFWANDLVSSNSHAVAFAYHSYKSAYAKAKYPEKFFQVYLKHAKHRLKPKDEIRKLVQDARANSIIIKTPDIRNKNKEFTLIGNDIYTGITDIKTIGSTAFEKIQDIDVPDSWLEFLLKISPILKSAAIPIVLAGSCDFYRLDRKKMEYELKLFDRFSDLEKEKLLALYKINKCSTLLELLQNAVTTIKLNKNRKVIFDAAIKDLLNPVYKLEYTCEQLEKIEIDLIGAPLSCTRLDGNNKTFAANIFCIDLIRGKIPKYARVAGIIREPKIIKTKKGDQMAFLSLEDHTGTASDLVVFPDIYTTYKHNIVEDLTVLLEITKSNTGSFIVNKIVEI